MSNEAIKNWNDQVLLYDVGKNRYIVRAEGIPYPMLHEDWHMANANFSGQINRIKAIENA